MEYPWRRPLRGTGQPDRIPVLRPLRQHQDLSPRIECGRDFSGDGLRPGLIIGEVSKHLLDPRIAREIGPGMTKSRQHFE